MSTETDDDNFLSRWSRRKAEERKKELRNEPDSDPVAEETAPGTVDLSDARAEEDAAEPDGSELTEDDVENLTKDSDFTVFMKGAVPAEIRRMALKKLWRLDPAYNVVDGLVEYGEDYSKLHENVGKIQSAYQVGKGYVFDDDHHEALADTAEKQPSDASRQDDAGGHDGDLDAPDKSADGHEPESDLAGQPSFDPSVQNGDADSGNTDAGESEDGSDQV